MSAPLSAVVRHVRGLAMQSHYQSLTDPQLLERFTSQRDEAAFALLMQWHGGLVHGVARRILHDSHAAEDVFQHTFLTLARRAGSIRKHEALASWLYGTAVRSALRMQRSAARRSARERQALRPQAEDVAEAAAWRELGAVVDEELQRLPEKYRAPLVLIYFAGQTQEEAARQLHCGKSALRGRLERAKRALHDRLLRRGVSLSIGLLAAGIAQSSAASALPAELVRATVREAMRCIAVKSATWVIGLGVFSRAKMVLMVGLLTAAAGWAVWQSGTQKPVEAKPEPSTTPQAQTVKKSRVDRFGDPLPEGAIARLGTMRFRPCAGECLAFSVNSKSLLTCGADKVIRTWDADSGRLLRERRLPLATFWPVTALSPDGRLAVISDTQDTLCIWDIACHQPLRRKISVRGAWPRAVFSPDGKTLAVGEDGGAVTAWNVETGKSRLLGKHKGQVYTLAFSDDGKNLLTLGADRTARIWDMITGREQSKISAPEGEGTAATISVDGKMAATWTFPNEKKDSQLRFWHADTGQPAQDWMTPKDRAIRAVRFMPDGKTVLLGTADGLLIWDALAGKVIRRLAGACSWGNQLILSPDGKKAASLGGLMGASRFSESMVHVWDLETGVPHAANNAENGHPGFISGVAIAPDGRTVASCSYVDARVRLWDAASGRLLRSWRMNEEFRRGELLFSADGKSLFIGTWPAIVCCETATGREIRRFPLGEGGKDHWYLHAMRLTDDGRVLLALGGSKSTDVLHAWDMTTGKRLRAVPVAENKIIQPYIDGGSLSPDGQLLAVDRGSILDTATGKERLHVSVGRDSWSGTPCTFSPDGSLIALCIRHNVPIPKGSGEATVVDCVQVFETATGLPVVQLKTGEMSHLVFTPDNRRLITVGPDSLRLWDLATGRTVVNRATPGRDFGGYGTSFATWSVALAPNGRTLATGNADTTILLWDLSPPRPDKSAAPLTTAQIEACWTDLAGSDAGRAVAALARLADVPQQAVPMLHDRLHPAKAPRAEELRRLIADLDDEQFERRRAAAKRLAALDDLAHAALREALQHKPSLETRRRIEGLLAEAHLARTQDARRQLRAIGVLEAIGTAEARQVLGILAKGAPEARLTRTAQAALDRLVRRP